MKYVKAIGITTLIVGAIIGGLWHSWGKGLAADAKIGAAFAAKHVCSCVHVAGRSLDSCLDDFVADVSQLTITHEDNIVTATAPLGLANVQAKFESGLGCAFVES